MKHRYLTLDVFTKRVFGGNPLSGSRGRQGRLDPVHRALLEIASLR